MAPIIFDYQKLDKAKYDVHNPLDAARFQQNVMEFMDLVRETTVGDFNDKSNNENRRLVDEFCRFVNDKEVWHLAQMVIPEFRSSLVEQDHDYDDHVGEFALLNIVLRKLSFLPARRDDENILRTEGDMVRQRNERYIELLVTRGKGRKGMTQEERAESDKRIREVEAAIATVSMQHEQKGEQAESKTNISKDVKAKKGKEREKKEKEKGKGKGKEKENEKEKKKMK